MYLLVDQKTSGVRRINEGIDPATSPIRNKSFRINSQKPN